MNTAVTRLNTKSSKAEIQARIDTVIELIARKYKRSQIVEYLRSNHADWRATIPTIDKYIRTARDQIVDQMRATKDELRSEAVNDLRFLYKRALESDDLQMALRVRKELNELLCLKGEVKTETPELQDVTGSEMPDSLRTLFAKRLEVANPVERPYQEKRSKPDDPEF
jgi:hypothetical protein